MTISPNIDSELIPLPFLLFKDGRLRTANAGARVLFGLSDNELESYPYTSLFPSVTSSTSFMDDAGAFNKHKLEGHLQFLRGQVQSSKELLRLKVASFTSETDGSLRSILVVDLITAKTAAPQSPTSSPRTGASAASSIAMSGSASSPGLTGGSLASSPPASAMYASATGRGEPEDGTKQYSPTLPHLPSVIKRHSGEIRSLFGYRDRKRSHSLAQAQMAATIQEHVDKTSVRSGGSSAASVSGASGSNEGDSLLQGGPTSPRTSTGPSVGEADSKSGKAESDDRAGSGVKPSKSGAGDAASRQGTGEAASLMSLSTSSSRPSYFPGHQSRQPSISLTEAPAVVSPSLPPPLPSRHSNSDTSSSGPSVSQRSVMGSLTMSTTDIAEITAGLAQSAMSAHPRTGCIVSKSDMSCGYINSRTRELLMGIKSPEGEHSDPFDDNWTSPAAARVAAQQAGYSEEDAPLYEDEYELPVHISQPERGTTLQTSIANILRWSLQRRRARQHSRNMRDDASTRSGRSGSPVPSVGTFSSISESLRYRGADDNSTVMDEKPWLFHKPYKVFDAGFAQRVEDPFETLFDMTVRRGLTPTAGSFVTVGIETEVGPEEKCAFPPHECFTYAGQRAGPGDKGPIVPVRVRRRVVQCRAMPLKDSNGQHIGGVVWLRDITGETEAPTGSTVIPEGGVMPDGTPFVEASEDGTAPSTKPALNRSDTVKRGQPNATSSTPPLVSTPGLFSPTSPGFQPPSVAPGGGSDPFWQQIINSMPQMVWVTKPDGTHIYFNNKWYAYTGLQPEQSLGAGQWQNPFHPADVPASRAAWSRSLATGEEYSVEYRCRRSDGVWRWQLGRAQAMFDANGKIVAWFGTCTDVEEFVVMRTQLAETSKNLRRVIDLANVTLLCVDSQLKLLFLEGGGLLKREASTPETEGSAGTPLSDVIPSQTLINKAVEILNGVTESARVEVQIRQEVWVVCLLTPLRVESGPTQGVVIVASDITEVKEAEAALKQSYEEQSRLLASETAAKEASRLKSEFTANLSHEIRTPITGMIGMSELLLEEDMTPAQHDSVRKILKSGEILLKMVGDVLDIGKVEAGKLELDIQPFRVVDLVSDATNMFRLAASKKGLRFNENCSSIYQGDVLGDLPRMRQVLLNFLANSVKFTKQGYITLQVKQDEETANSIRVRFVVEDSGIGIAKNVIPILFQAFQQADTTTSREHGGTGLGLVISKRLVELMNGTVHLDSDLGKGTRITVIVPFRKSINLPSQPARRPSQRRAAEPYASVPNIGDEAAGLATGPGSPSDGPRQEAQSPSLDSANMTNPGSDTGRSISSSAPLALPSESIQEMNRAEIDILLAEDNPLNQEIFVRGIKRMGFNVRAVNNGKEAVDAVREKHWDIVLMDGHMPIIDGYEATRLIRQDPTPRVSQTTVIALTASAIAGDREKCLEAGMNGYLSKPVRLKLLEETIVNFLTQPNTEQQPRK